MITEKSLQTLELIKILEQVAQHTAFSAGRELLLDWQPTTEIDVARVWQAETSEARKLFVEKTNVSLGGVTDVRDAALSTTRGVTLEARTLLDIRYTMRRVTTLRRTIGRQQAQYPMIAELINQMDECNDLQMEIDRVMDENAEIKDSASPKLAMTRRDLKVAFERLQTRLLKITSNTGNAMVLQDNLITMRNGRYVIPIKADYKGRIPGIVHDSSSSGATLFIEPLETVELGNKWRELQLEEEKEIWRILTALSGMVAEQHGWIVHAVEVMARLDVVFARARYADQINAVEPTLLPFRKPPTTPHTHPGSTIQLRAARHPLLRGNPVPIDLELDENTWMLVVTGPNTGGKTVSLKTVGLLALMAQSGLHLPCESARITVFGGIYADIGDEQSIEQSLSTFSSHTRNIIHILEHCNAQSLVLLDELGAGTDPAEGSALARALLTHLLQRNVTTIVTTHHPELKIYSVETKGVRNASMEFDVETLAPTYRLIIGLPGRSNALAIAQRLGLPVSIIEEARGMVKTEDLVADDLLDEIHRTREDMRRQQADVTKLRLDIQNQRDELQARLDKVEDERRNILIGARRNAENELEDIRKEIKRVRAELRDAALPLDKVLTLQKSVTALESSTQQPVKMAVDLPKDTRWAPRLGDNVWVQSLNMEGVIQELTTTEALVQMGNLRVRVPFGDMQQRDKSLAREIKRGQVRTYDEAPSLPIMPRGKSPGLELDLRGQRVEDALDRLQEYVDAAYAAALPFARIIHGKGTGALRKAVREALDAHPLVSRHIVGEAKEGGDGVTVIYLASPI
jgi:DNA mismatch repair protein MutS2